MPWSESLPQFSLAGTLLTVLLLFFAAFGEPLLGRRAFTWLSHRRDGDERALGLLYAVTMAVHVLWGLLVLVVLLLSPELNLVDLGLRTPDAFAPVVGAAAGGLLALAVFWVLVNGLPARDRIPFLDRLPGRGAAKGTEAGQGRSGRRGRRASGHRGRRGSGRPTSLPEPGHQQYLLLPRTRREQGLAAGMAVTGGVFGELLYRGLFITLVASMGAPLWSAAVLSILLFSAAHAYQGWWGLLSAGFSGTLFTVLYLGTGSLVVPVLVHVALNLRSVAFPPVSEHRAPEGAAHHDDHDDDGSYEDDRHDDGYGYDGYGSDEQGYGRTGEFEAVGPGEEPPGVSAPYQQAPSTGTPAFGTPAFGTPAPQQQAPRPYPPAPPAGPSGQYPPAPPAYGSGDPRHHRSEGDTPGPGVPYRN
ncbi:hypothetical protein GCM10007079_43960 [Nocardiopsis terrae]|uniref:CAAX prenyl protease 2/Lysostaphin resistance protein A-like domain-containing protein n=1 Tax=Nocardiopsis terrae TaxID=372655 RepID=A0ABR9HL71_9ACTN|nr:CPBP family intramembrane glutamic endopeptidase [Nocardiopsis terrae]MBE1459790.1 hypothetical protein [Nocardiopsis terrae]GHC93964.1 hypothetical protein GCM10007079_43960 [Nocardiopsis terrae]